MGGINRLPRSIECACGKCGQRIANLLKEGKNVVKGNDGHYYADAGCWYIATYGIYSIVPVTHEQEISSKRSDAWMRKNRA